MPMTVSPLITLTKRVTPSYNAESDPVADLLFFSILDPAEVQMFSLF